ncbi:MAG: hypothetical protein ACT4OS_08970 [Acidimicrobiales bacterium]
MTAPVAPRNGRRADRPGDGDGGEEHEMVAAAVAVAVLLARRTGSAPPSLVSGKPDSLGPGSGAGLGISAAERGTAAPAISAVAWTGLSGAGAWRLSSPGSPFPARSNE